MITRRTNNIENTAPNVQYGDNRTNPSGRLLQDVLSEKAQRQIARLEAQQNQQLSNSPFVLKSAFKEFLLKLFPKELKGLLLGFTNTVIRNEHFGRVAVLTSTGTAKWYGTVGPFSGNVYVAGRKIAITGTKSRYLRVALDGTGANYVTAMPVGDMPDDAEYYDLHNTFGDIHITRA